MTFGKKNQNLTLKTILHVLTDINTNTTKPPSPAVFLYPNTQNTHRKVLFSCTKGVIQTGLFKRRKRQETRAEPSGSRIVTLEGLIGAADKITREQVMSIPTVAACIGKIAETAASLPVRLYRRSGEEVEEITDDSRIRLLNGETGDTLSTVDMWKAAIEDYYVGRGAWIFVDSDGVNVRGLHYVDSRSIGVLCNADPIFKAFRVNVGGREFYDFQFIKLLRRTRNGWDNIPVQSESNEAFSAAYNSLLLENQMNSTGGCQPGFIKLQNRITREQIDRIRQNYKEMYSNNKDESKLVVLNEGMDFVPAASTAAELQMNENKRANSVEICKIFGFPHTVIDGGATEDDNRKFTAAVVALLNQIETALDAVLLLESEKREGYYWAFDTKELTRGSMKERYEAYEIAARNNILQLDEIRREEDYEPLGFNFVRLGLSDVLLNPETMEVFTPNTGQTKNLLTGEERAEERGWITKNGRHIFIGDKGSSGSSHRLYHHDPGTGGGGSGGGKSAKKVDKSQKSGTIEKRPKSLKIGIKERERLNHQIATDFPDLKPSSKLYDYENRNHFYQFSVNDFGSYSFHYKIRIEGNQDVIRKIRKGKL